MNKEVIESLLQLNHHFYNLVGASFSKTRNYGWPGWKILCQYLRDNNVKVNTALDIACGNGRFFESLIKFYPDVLYLGVDNNEILLHDAELKYKGRNVSFKNIDILKETENIPGKYDLVVMFGIMHHIPAHELRELLLNNIKQLVVEGGYLCLSFWDFIGKKYQLRTNEQEVMQELGLLSSDLEPGDHILDWRSDQKAYRYAHAYSEAEILELFKKCSLTLLHNYQADGRDGVSNRYYLLKV
jgi:SAM-dependent methyltransferase